MLRRSLVLSCCVAALWAPGCAIEAPPLAQSSMLSSPPVDDSPAGECASSFGQSLTPGFGRIDGVVHAVQKPSDTECVLPNSDHVVLQVRMANEIYRMVVNVKNDREGQDPRIRFATIRGGALGPPYAEGWHTGVALDYPRDLGIHTASFEPMEMDALVAKLAELVVVGSEVSVFAVNGVGRPESAHKVHKNRFGAMQDGAVVLDPRGPSPTFLLFHFDGQTF